MIIDQRMLRRMNDELFRELALAVVDEATRRCLLVVSDDKWELAIDAVVEGHDQDGPIIRMTLER